MVRRRSRRARDPHPGLGFAGWPLAPGQPPAGLPAKGLARPNPHESAILRRLARPGAFLLVTFRAERPPLYTYESGAVVQGADGKALSQAEFQRLVRWLRPVRGENLFDLTPQRYIARRPEDAR